MNLKMKRHLHALVFLLAITIFINTPISSMVYKTQAYSNTKPMLASFAKNFRYETSTGNNISYNNSAGAKSPEITALPQTESIITPFAAGDNIKDMLTAQGISPATILTAPWYILTFTDAAGNAVENPTMNDYFQLEFFFEIPPEILNVMEGGEYYNIKMPGGLLISDAPGTKYPVYGPGGVEVAEIEVQADGSINLIFKPEIKDVDDPKGSFFVGGHLDDTVITAPGDIIVTFPDEETLPPAAINVKPEVETSIDKDGYFDRGTNPNEIFWEVYANKSMDELTDFKITDILPPNVTLEEVEVYKYDVDFNGNPIAGSETMLRTPENYEIIYDNVGNPTVNFNGTVNFPVKIKYKTTINEDAKPGNNGGSMTFQNNVTMDANEINEQTASSTIKGKYSPMLKKDAIGYDPDTQTFTWEIQYNYRENVLPPDYTLIIDTMDPGLELLMNSFQVKDVVFNNKGNPVLGDDTDPSDYIITQTSDGFEINFPNGLNHGINIRYQTKITDIVEGTTNYGNKVQDNNGNSGTGTGTANQQNIIKNITNVNTVEHIITWEVIINRNNYEMNHFFMEDHLSGGHQYTGLNDIVITDLTSNNILSFGPPGSSTADYTATQSTPVMTITFLNNYDSTNHTFRIVYKTHYSPEDAPDDGFFRNSAYSEWYDENNNKHTSTDKDGYSPDFEQTHNGSKSGSYNAATKEITWVIRINSDNLALENAYIEDTILDGQNYIADSVHIYHFSPGTPPVRTVELDSNEYSNFRITEPASINNETLTIEIPDSPANEDRYYWVEYKTSLENEVIGTNTYHNTATFYNNLTEDFVLDADVSVNNGGSYAEKKGYQSGGYVWWEIVVNPSQSTLDNVVVSDICSDNQLINIDSVEVFGTNVAANGDISINTNDKLLLDTDYTVNYFQNSDGNWQMDIEFKNTITRPYIIRFNVTVLAGNAPQAELSNNATIKGTHDEVIEGGGSGNISVGVGSGGGWVTGSIGSVGIKKTDDNTKKGLAGATFQLYSDSAMTKPVGGIVTSDKNGNIFFEQLGYGTYYLYEVQPPNGYSPITPNPMEIIVNKSSTENEISYTAANTPTYIVLEKIDGESNTPLAGAEFALEKLAADNVTWERIRANEQFISDENGKVHIYALSEGTYRLKEIKAPDGYKPDYASVYNFNIIKNPDNSLKVNKNDLDNKVLNYPTKVTLQKLNHEGTPLPLAHFILEKYSEQSGEWEQIHTSEIFITDANGMLTVKRLEIGKYRLIEVDAPDGYSKDTVPKEFEIKEDINGIIQDVVIEPVVNHPTLVTLNKQSPNGKNLSGAVFELYQKNNIDEYERIRPDENFVTDEGGLLEIGNLLPGEYSFVEVMAPSGYSLNNTPIYFTLEFDENGEILPIVLEPFINEPSVGIVHKTDPDGNPLKGAKFNLEYFDDSSKEWLTYKLENELISDENGEISRIAIPVGKYRLIETQAPDGYMLLEEPIEFEVVQDNDGHIEPVDIGAIINIPNTVILEKTNEDENPLQGAVFTLEKQINNNWLPMYNGEEFTTGSNGKIKFEKIEAGTYRFVEVKAPSGYEKLLNPYEFTVEENLTETIVIKIENKLQIKPTETPTFNPTPTPKPAPIPQPVVTPEPTAKPKPTDTSSYQLGNESSPTPTPLLQATASPSGGNISTVPQTGDYSPIEFYILFAAASAFGLAISFIGILQKKKNK